MKLRDLDAHFVGEWTETTWRSYGQRIVDGVQGLCYQCPKCAVGLVRGEADGLGFVEGAHYILNWFTNPVNVAPVPDAAFPGPGRWTFEGTSIDDITFVGPAAASVLLTGGCGWHGFVRNGEAA